jgi:hypothetical protein
MIRAVSTFCLVACASLALAGCDSIGGRKKVAPDEFRVVAHSPLVMPPNAELRPPRPGAPRPQEVTPAEDARRAIIGPAAAARAAPATGSPAEAVLVQKVEAKADPGIRQTVNEESKVIADSNRSFVDTLIFWREPPPPGVAVDPAKEQQRLREGQATGQPAEGNTPQIQRRRRGLLEGLF